MKTFKIVCLLKKEMVRTILQITSLVRRGKRHDYFTSALPWPQKGPGVEIPLGTSAPVLGFKNISVPNLVTAPGNVIVSEEFSGNGRILTTTSPFSASKSTVNALSTDVSGVYADLTTATAYTINSLRQAFPGSTSL